MYLSHGSVMERRTVEKDGMKRIAMVGLVGGLNGLGG